jgi:hypothetical protein
MGNLGGNSGFVGIYSARASLFSDMLSAEVLQSFSCVPDLYRESL